jgi:N-acyl-D-aspartate/D-glutamate deacylase
MLTALRFAREGLFMHDWRIKGALLFDGSGSAPIEADLAMASSVVAAVGRDLGPARRVVDARGLFLAPGLIDLHTPYDAKALGGSALPPSSLRGVTIFVTGNCGFGLAPNTLATRDLLLRNLSGVEGMDLEALQSGVHLGFESFSDDLAALRRCKHGSTWQCFPSTQQSARW